MRIRHLQENVEQLAKEKHWHTEHITPDWLVSRLAMIHSEVSEAVECIRKSKTDIEFVEELADIVLRVMCVASAVGVDVEDAIQAKMAKNRNRTWDYKSGIT